MWKNVYLKIKEKKLGFTLIELLVVVAVLAILASISYIGVSDIRKSIRDNKRRADLNLLARALEAFKADYGQYPAQNYYSTQTYSGGSWSADADQTMLPILKEGGTLPFVYLNNSGPILKEKAIEGGYLSEYVKDPINQSTDWNDSRIYMYWSAAFAVVSDINSPVGYPFAFPLDCPDTGTCGTTALMPGDIGYNEATWGACCNGGCFDEFCVYNNNGSPNQSDDQLAWVINNSTNFGHFCYGANSTRNMALLATRLEKPSKPEERFDTVFAFCPTADANHPDHDDYLDFKALFPRSKPCHDGSDGTTDYGCVDTVNGTNQWRVWNLNNYNYFIPLTGEYNLN